FCVRLKNIRPLAVFPCTSSACDCLPPLNEPPAPHPTLNLQNPLAPGICMDLIVARPEGLYCPAGDFYIDPWRGVDRAVITHGHGDHARWGSRHYLAAAPGEGVLRARLGQDINLQT